MRLRGLVLVFVIVLTFGIKCYYENALQQTHQLSSIETIVKGNNNYFKEVHVYPLLGNAYFYKNNTIKNDFYKVQFTNKDQFINRVKNVFGDTKIPIYNKIEQLTKSFLICCCFIIVLMFAIVLLNMMMNNFSSGNLFQVTNTHTVQFDEVIGLESTKKELREYVNILKYRGTYLASGYTIPKRLLFVGPPGTGKTYLAKAFARESGANFISVCGSDFVEIYVGMGSKRVRELFQKARKDNRPCIIFIDEIDAIGQKRTHSYSSSEHNSTLNSLLVEIDGFSSTDNILVIASTNMPDVLDPALTRSGRFDKQIIFDPPNLDERKDMFKLYLQCVKISAELDQNLEESLLKLAKCTPGLTGADIKNVVNQSVYNFLLTIPDKTNIEVGKGVTYENLHKSIDEIVIGMEKPERKMTPDEIKRVAYHEAGHTIVGYLLDTTSPPIKTSIIPRGLNALGFTQPEPEDKKLYTQQDILGRICVLFGGRAAEEVILGSVSTGASDDFKKIDYLIERLFTDSRFEDLGFVNPYKHEEKVTDPDTSKFIKSMLVTLYSATQKMIYKNQKIVHELAKHLLDNEVIVTEDIERIIGPELRKSVLSNSIIIL